MSKHERIEISVVKPIKTILTCARKHAPIASQARHFPRERGKLMVKEERNHIFYMSKNKRIENKCEKNKNNEMTHIKSCPRLSGSKRTTFRGAKRRCKSE